MWCQHLKLLGLPSDRGAGKDKLRSHNQPEVRLQVQAGAGYRPWLAARPPRDRTALHHEATCAHPSTQYTSYGGFWSRWAPFGGRR